MTDVREPAAIKGRQQQMWGSGRYGAVGNRILLVAELLCEAVDLQGGERVLDVACGTGNATLAAARRFASVVGVDYSGVLLAEARRRADAEGLDVDLREGDAEALPFEDGTFDVVLSTCGAMFAPDQEQTAAELLRVCRAGGRIGMVNWTPESWVAEVGRIIGRYLPPPAGLRPPVAWGDPARVEELLGGGADVRVEQRCFLFRFPSPEHHVALFADSYPPIVAALAQLGDDDGEALRSDLLELARRRNVGPDDHLVLSVDYLEVVATKHG